MKTKFVYVVRRVGNGNDLTFIFENENHAKMCAERLQDRYPDEKITFHKNVIRKDYK